MNGTGTCPEPASVAACGLPTALSTTRRLALAEPAVEGVKVTPTVQVPWGATFDPQVFVWENSLLLLPANEMLVRVSGKLPQLVRVTG